MQFRYLLLFSAIFLNVSSLCLAEEISQSSTGSDFANDFADTYESTTPTNDRFFYDGFSNDSSGGSFKDYYNVRNYRSPVNVIDPSTNAQASPALVKEEKPTEPLNKAHFSRLPFLKSLADDNNIKLPLPLGISIARVDIESPFSLDLVDVKYKGNSLFKLGSDIVTIGEAEAKNYTFRVDAYLTPFLNVYGYYGETEGSIPVIFTSPIDLPIIGRPSFTQKIEFNAETLGVGITLAGGYPVTPDYTVFGVYDINFSRSDLDITDTPVDSIISAFYLGLDTKVFNHKMQFWGGAMHHKIKETLDIQVTDLIEIPLLKDISTDIGISNNINWTPLVGTAFRFNEHISIIVEKRFGERDLLNTMLELRF